jgi:hypothetical protein
VVEFSSAGRVLAVFGSPGSGRGQLNQPVALTLAAAAAGLLTAQQEVFANPAPLIPVTNEPVPPR